MPKALSPRSHLQLQWFASQLAFALGPLIHRVQQFDIARALFHVAS